MKQQILAAAAGLGLLFSGVASADVVASAGTGGLNASDFVLVGGTNLVNANNSAYDQSITSPMSTWVWDARGSNSITVQYSVDLTGFDASSATLSGLWGVDNIGTVSLNGTEFASLTANDSSSYSSLSALAAGAGLFDAGLNVIEFVLSDTGGPQAFRAAFTIEADAATAAVPLPAALPLFGAGLGLFGMVRGRRRAA